MRSLIIALIILIIITAIVTLYTFAAARSADDFSEKVRYVIKSMDSERCDELITEWKKVETLLRPAVHEERLRAVRVSLSEFRHALSDENEAESAGELLMLNIREAFTREKPLFWQIF